jgi:putative heme iron utilization protein
MPVLLIQEQAKMDLKEYFAKAKGIGILATADVEGEVDVAIYAKPMVVDENTVALVMRERLSHQNIRGNPNAAYMFIEEPEDNRGIRLYLAMIREETNFSVVEKIIEEHPEICPENDEANKYLVHFKVEQVRELVGSRTL